MTNVLVAGEDSCDLKRQLSRLESTLIEPPRILPRFWPRDAHLKLPSASNGLMSLGRVLQFACLVVCSTVALAQAAPAISTAVLPRFEKRACAAVLAKEDEGGCGMLSVAEDRSNPKTRAIRLQVVIVRSHAPNAPRDSVLFGDSSVANVANVHSSRGIIFVEDRDYVVLGDVSTIDGIIKASYETISGPAGQPRQWGRDRTLYIPDVYYVHTGVNRKTGKVIFRGMTYQQYADEAGPGLEKHGYFEREIGRSVQVFGHVASAMRAWEVRTEANGKVSGRGVNSIQLVNDGKRWWITSINWDNETPDTPIPQELLRSNEKNGGVSDQRPPD